jgi:hypothetical protein
VLGTLTSTYQEYNREENRRNPCFLGAYILVGMKWSLSLKAARPVLGKTYLLFLM